MNLITDKLMDSDLVQVFDDGTINTFKKVNTISYFFLFWKKTIPVPFATIVFSLHLYVQKFRP